MSPDKKRFVLIVIGITLLGAILVNIPAWCSNLAIRMRVARIHVGMTQEEASEILHSPVVPITINGTNVLTISVGEERSFLDSALDRTEWTVKRHEISLVSGKVSNVESSVMTFRF